MKTRKGKHFKRRKSSRKIRRKHMVGGTDTELQPLSDLGFTQTQIDTLFNMNVSLDVVQNKFNDIRAHVSDANDNIVANQTIIELLHDAVFE